MAPSFEIEFGGTPSRRPGVQRRNEVRETDGGLRLGSPYRRPRATFAQVADLPDVYHAPRPVALHRDHARLWTGKVAQPPRPRRAIAMWRLCVRVRSPAWLLGVPRITLDVRRACCLPVMDGATSANRQELASGNSPTAKDSHGAAAMLPTLLRGEVRIQASRKSLHRLKSDAYTPPSVRLGCPAHGVKGNGVRCPNGPRHCDRRADAQVRSKRTATSDAGGKAGKGARFVSQETCPRR